MQFTSHIKSFKKILQKVSLPLLGIAIFGFGVASIVAQSSQPEPVLGFAWNGNAPTPTHLGCLKLSNNSNIPNPGQVSTTTQNSSSSGQLNTNQVPNSGQIVTTQGTLSPNQSGQLSPNSTGSQTQSNSTATVLPGCGLGWIGMNSQTPGLSGISGSSPFIWGVSLDMISGALSGYAFARSAPDPSNPGNDWVNTSIGWITFNSPSSGVCPDSPSNCAPKVNLSTGKVTGWIRVCSVLNQGCSGSSGLHPQAGGWDGWIKLSDDNPLLHYVSPNFTSFGGVTYSAVSGDFCGFAWGGPVGGWIDFGSGPNCSDTVTPTDSCPNINGDQNGIPDGLIIDSNGDCVVDIVDPPCSNCPQNKELILQSAPQIDPTSPYRTTLTWYSPTGTSFTSCQIMNSFDNSNNLQVYPSGWVSGITVSGLSGNIPVSTPLDSVEIPVVDTLYTIVCSGTVTRTASTHAYQGTPTSGVDAWGGACLKTTALNLELPISWKTQNVNDGSCLFSSVPDNTTWDDQQVNAPITGDDTGSIDVDFSMLPVDSSYSFTITCTEDINNMTIPSPYHTDTTTVSYQSGACSIGPGGAPRPRFEEN